MAIITNATEAWAGPVVLAGDEIWQARSGSIFVTTTGSPATDDGILLVQGAAVQLSAGLSVRYRTKGPVSAVIVREAV